MNDNPIWKMRVEAHKRHAHVTAPYTRVDRHARRVEELVHLRTAEVAYAGGAKSKARADVPYPFETAAEMLQMAAASGLPIAQMKLANELKFRTKAEVDRGIARLWEVMNACISRGMAGEGILPGGLKVRRRAKGIHDALIAERGLNLTAPHTINDWMSLYAMAVNEENAAGGQVVTAPTNGAAGVLPAVIRYWLDHVPGAHPARLGEFLLTAAAIGGLCKHNASISGAECACQAEVGSPPAMSAAGLAAVLGGTPMQVENAAEITLEHHLGMTCDPVKGLVQVPCTQIGANGEFGEAEMLESMDNHLWTVEKGTLYKTNMRSLRWQQVGTAGDWENTVAMVADGGYLWSVEKDGTLFRTDKNGAYQQIGEKGLLSEVTLIVAMDGMLYVVENGTLYRTRG